MLRASQGRIEVRKICLKKCVRTAKPLNSPDNNVLLVKKLPICDLERFGWISSRGLSLSGAKILKTFEKALFVSENLFPLCTTKHYTNIIIKAIAESKIVFTFL
jgi:hypothetical protein